MRFVVCWLQASCWNQGAQTVRVSNWASFCLEYMANILDITIRGQECFLGRGFQGGVECMFPWTHVTGTELFRGVQCFLCWLHRGRTLAKTTAGGSGTDSVKSGALRRVKAMMWIVLQMGRIERIMYVALTWSWLLCLWQSRTVKRLE